MLRAGAAAMSVLWVCAAVGCGGSSSTSRAPTAAERAWAGAVNLRAGDVPGLAAAKAFGHPPPPFTPFGSEAERCAYGEALTARLASVDSTRLRTSLSHTSHGAQILSLIPTETVDSVVQFAPSRAAAARVMALAQSSRLRVCIARAWTAWSVRGEQSRRSEPFLKDASVAATRAQALGHRVTGLELSGEETAFVARGHGPSPLKERWLMFARGRAIVVLKEFGDPSVLAPAEERKLLALLMQRSAERDAP
jgi:hypothetical protein